MTQGAFEPIVGVDRYTEAGRLHTDDLAVRNCAAELLAREAEQALGELTRTLDRRIGFLQWPLTV